MRDEVIRLHVVEGLCPREAGKKAGISEGSARRILIAEMVYAPQQGGRKKKKKKGSDDDE